MSQIHTNETALAASLRMGSVKAFEAVYRLYVERLYTYCYEAIHIRQETEEVVHDIFMTLWNRRTTIEPEAGVGQLLFAIARKRRIDAFRRLMNNPIYEDYVNHQNSIADTETEPLEYDDFQRTFHRVLDTMPVRLRTLIILSKLDGLSNREIAERLGVAEKTIRNQLSLAIKELHTRIAPYIDSPRKIPPNDQASP